MHETHSQAQKASRFRELHHATEMLLLPNVWDVASALIVAEAGFPAIATSSAGIALSLGYPDGERISPGEMIARVARIVGAVDLPLSADIESGYGPTPDDAATTARELIHAGAIGMNLEDKNADQLLDLSVAVEKIKAVRSVATELHVPIVVNARTDVYMLPSDEVKDRYPEALRRLGAYRDAGADCVFVPGLKDAFTIGRLVKDIQCPVNILGVPGAPSVSELKKLGVARVSLGSGPMRSGLGLLRRIASDLRSKGTYALLDEAVPLKVLNELMRTRESL